MLCITLIFTEINAIINIIASMRFFRGRNKIRFFLETPIFFVAFAHKKLTISPCDIRAEGIYAVVDEQQYSALFD